MPLVFTPEDGTGLADANSFGTVEYADDYFALRSITSWAALTTAAKQTALVKATDYIEMRFATRFIGQCLTDTQSLAWPRYQPGQSSFVQYPDQLRKACCEYAILASASPLMPELEVDDSGRPITKKIEKIGPLVEETTYQEVTNFYRSYPTADLMMRKLLRSAGGGVVR